MEVSYKYKKDYEPILPPGRHEMSPELFEFSIVNELGGERRLEIWSKFKKYILKKIIELDIKCELWLDGSFITKCTHPNDIDGCLMISSDYAEKATDLVIDFLEYFDDMNPKLDSDLDIFLCVSYPIGHTLREGSNDPNGWAEQWSRERNSNWLKGFVVIPFR